MKNILLIVLISALLVSFSKGNIDGPWIISKKGNVVLYTRPENYSKTPSPNIATINSILDEQNECLKIINHRLGTSFNSNFSVYLFNYDEAKEKIGTNSGGYAISRKRVIYYTYNHVTKKSNNGNRVYLGKHELVHLVTTKEFGHSNLRLMGEGYAVSINGIYGRERSSKGEIVGKSLEKWMKEYVSTDKILKPSEMINGRDIPESLFYPQAGFFINWLFDNYGTQKINKLYKSSNKALKIDFEKITGESFDSIEIKYLEFCNSLK